MNDLITIARQQFLTAAALDDAALTQALSMLAGSGIDQGDLYFQYSRHESWALEDGLIKEADFSIDQGVGVRAVSGEKTGFAYSNEIVLPALLEASKVACSIAHRGQQGTVKVHKTVQPHNLYPSHNPSEDLTVEDKVGLLRTIDESARKQDSRVGQVIASLTSRYEIILVMATDGTIAADVRPLVRMDVTVIAENKQQRGRGYSGAGGRYGFSNFARNRTAQKLVDEAVRQAIVNLDAIPAPAGNMTVVLGAGWPGVLLHEAVGHGLEGDAVRKKTSVFSGCVGERVASRGVTVVDDGTLAGRRGSLNVDDEGTPTQCTTLIENGILKTFMQDKMSARLMETQSTGNGRRESYAHLPMTRMTNTYMLAGDLSPEEIIESVDDGLYAVNFGGGQVDIISGKFVFSASEGYLIKNGKITVPVKGASLIGNGPDVLTRVSMIGNDLKLDDGIGTCGKNGQMVPVGVGQPTLRIDGITVGGTAS